LDSSKDGPELLESELAFFITHGDLFLSKKLEFEALQVGAACSSLSTIEIEKESEKLRKKISDSSKPHKKHTHHQLLLHHHHHHHQHFANYGSCFFLSHKHSEDHLPA